MEKYLKVMFDNKGANYEYQIDKVNIATTWDPSAKTPEEFGGFNFSTEDKILRWLHRGDMIYDVIIPDDAEVILCNEEKGVYRTNKIIITNPRVITDELVLDLYHHTTLSDKIIAQCLITLLWRDRLDIAKYIVNDRVNCSNIDVFVSEFESYASKDGHFSYEELGEKSKTIYNMLKYTQTTKDLA